MNVCVAGIEAHMELIQKVKPPNVLFSFYTANDKALQYAKSDDCKFFLLDSGAFTMQRNAKAASKIEDYADRYIEYINANDIGLFFELDIDDIIGIKEVERLRRKIENKTGKQPIPVFHKSRGKQYFIDMCKEYSYVAIGGIADAVESKKWIPHFPWFIDTAHEYGCRIHGLGFTQYAALKTLHFDSVDSTTWLGGGKYGKIYSLKKGYPTQQSVRKDGYKVNGKKANEYNLRMILEYTKWL